MSLKITFLCKIIFFFILVSVIEDKCEKIEIPDSEAEKSLLKADSAIDTQSIASSPTEPNRQYTNEVQNFVQKKNIAQG